jgi:methionyl-tRNA formyltransferase
VKRVAQKQGLKIFQPHKVRDKSFIENIKALKPSAIVVSAYGQLLPLEILVLPKFGCINIHASLLPQYRGAAPINWAIMNGETKTGITIMLMDEGMDTGPLLLQIEVAITAEDTAGSLSQKLSEVGADAALQALRRLLEGELKPRPQTGDTSYAPLLKKSDGLINWKKTARELCNVIRGMNPWPGAYSFLENERIKILKSAVLKGEGEPGVIKMIGKHEIQVGTGERMLSILEVQPQNKPTMSIQAFLQGRKLRENIKFSDRQNT